MSKGKLRGQKQTQVLWADLRAWIEQLYEEHHARVDVAVCIVPQDWAITSAVSVTVYCQSVGKDKRVLWDGWRRLEQEVHGSAEAAALQMVSQALLELGADKERSERQTLLL